MSYEIQAWLASDGAPGLRLIDAQSGSVRLSWQAVGHCPAQWKPLFHDLLLLSAGRALDLDPPLGRCQNQEPVRRCDRAADTTLSALPAHLGQR